MKKIYTRTFLLLGGTPVADRLHVARTVARRAERRLWTLNRREALPTEVFCFINRLSDLLFSWPAMSCNAAGGPRSAGGLSPASAN